METLVFVLWYMALDVKDEISRHATMEQCTQAMREEIETSTATHGIWVCERQEKSK